MFSLPPKSLYSICKRIFSGGTPSTNIDEYWNGDIPWLSSGETSNRYISSTIKKITKKGVDNSSTKLAKEGSIVIASAGQGHTRGQTSLLLCDVYINQSVIALEIDPELANPKYVFYNISSRYDELRTISDSTSSRGSLTTKLIGDLVLNLPERHIQDKIADFLFIIDSKITLNEEINANLEQLAIAEYHHIFDSIKPTVPLDSYKFLIETGKRPSGGIDLNCKDIPSIGAENVKQLGYYDYSKTKFISSDYYQSMKKGKSEDEKMRLYVYKDGGTPGNYIPHFSMFGKGYPFNKFSINEHVFQIDFGSEELNAFAYFFFNTEEVRHELEVRGGKAAIPGIGQSAITDLTIYDLQSEEVQHFSKFAYDIVKQILSNCVQSTNLMHLRNYLLPRLMSGEIDVSQLDLGD